MKNKKKSKYTAPNIKVDTIATEHWIAANSDDEQETKNPANSKKDNDKRQGSDNSKAW